MWESAKRGIFVDGELRSLYDGRVRQGQDLKTHMASKSRVQKRPFDFFQAFKVHRIVLSARCPFFKAAFEFPETREGKLEIPLTGNLIQNLIKFVYIGELMEDELKVEDLLELIVVAKMFLMEELEIVCSEAILKNSNSLELIRILNFCEDRELEGLAKRIENYFLPSFENMVTHDKSGIEELQETVLLRLLAHDRLWVKTEETVFQAVKRWVRHDPEHRERLWAHLLPAVRFLEMELPNLNAIFQESKASPLHTYPPVAESDSHSLTLISISSSCLFLLSGGEDLHQK
jgi:hypothetical protein